MTALAATDYSGLEGLQGAALKQAVKRIASPHVEISYGDKTWNVFAKADVRLIDGKEAWFDMYSNRLVYISSGHDALNIEHAVANSWWGGQKNAAYKDVHHLNPSDADANGRKSNHPLGVIGGAPVWSNGLTSIGAPAASTGGGAPTVFEPADEYKGDFARAYFYIFTLYDDIAWEESPAWMYDRSSYPTLKPWAYDMLLEWAKADPVDRREAARNAAVAEFQQNENPYVAIPGLAEYVWGSKRNTPFSLADAMTAPVADRPAAPGFGDYYLAGVNTWTGRWWESFPLYIDAPEGCEIYYNISGEEDFRPYDGGVTIPAASISGETVTVKAYAVDPADALRRRSSIATLTLTAADGGKTDYMHARWGKVKALSEITEDDCYVLVASKAKAVMSATKGGTASSSYVSVAGNVDINASGEINLLPEGTGVVKFIPSGGNTYYVSVSSLSLEPAGFLQALEPKKVTISEEGMPASLKLLPAGNFVVDFGSSYGTLQYNASSPRFSVYTSSQQPLDLYRCIETPSSSVTLPAYGAEESAGTRIFNIQGVELHLPAEVLPAGIYIIVNGKNARKIIKR